MITENALYLLEFPKLLRIISAFSNSEASQKAVAEIRPLYDRGEIEKRLGLLREIRMMSHEGAPLKLSRFSDISTLLAKIRPQGAVADSVELAGLTPFLNILSGVSLQLEKRDDLIFLKDLTCDLTGFPDILWTLERSIDSEGNILDSASSTLSELRADVRRLKGRITKRLEEMMRDEGLSVFLQDSYVTERSGRWVIPVRMDSKGQVPGVVHDVSRSGETAFIEPLAIIGLSNELENLIAEQKAEEIRILREISSKIRGVADLIEAQYKTLVYLDLLNCIARFSDELRMEEPQIDDSGSIRLRGARHPLLMLTLRKSGRGDDVVPLDVSLGGDDRVMVITGSNAGGKTIAIKTISLLLLMALSGMPVPADSATCFPLVHDLLVDIGDEQSIENSLSTFSAHVSNISDILKKADSKSLVLIDELGTGTDPDEGAALACAVLKEIRDRGALLFATTHLTDIKGFVHRTEGMINASMEFDHRSLTPLYRLRVGEPGQSHALEIAKRYGLPERIIDSAKGMLGGIKVEFDNLIADLNAKRAEYERALHELRKERSGIEEKTRLLEERLSETEKREKEVIAKAYREASDIIAETKRRMNAFLDDLKKKDKESRREVVKKIVAEQEEAARKLRAYDMDYAIPSVAELHVGDQVFVRSLGRDATVLEAYEDRNRLRVRAGSMEVEVPLSDVGARRGKALSPLTPPSKSAVPGEEVSSRLNLIGLRVDEALSRLEPFLNHASLAGLTEVTVIHGFGTGALSRAVCEHLTGHPLVKHFRKGEPPEGGAGVTVVTLI
ncbi:MAG TPA: endonuclease MutS2 [Thermodesulfovibrionales bacterium]|nr:endonuclease MutS2 [Thermodesulfovibrionales bacterium]